MVDPRIKSEGPGRRDCSSTYFPISFLMVFVLLSPAKTMKFDSRRPAIKGTVPHFGKKADALAADLKKKTPKELGKLMAISDKLAALNAERFKNFSKAEEAPAILAYQGDTYLGFAASTLTDKQIANAQIGRAH